MSSPAPRVPDRLHPLAKEILEGLRSRPEASAIVLGGGVALQHYCEYRDTIDVDAWWEGPVRASTQAAIREVMQAVASRHGLDLGLRSWRETESYELRRGRQKVFSFQISQRTRELDSPLESAWAPVKIETFRDNLGAKMNALVDRGAPRDFLDAYEVCSRGLASESDCWDAWSQKNPGLTVEEGRIRVLHHLEVLASRRPLESIPGAGEREAARTVREWIRGALCREKRP